MQLLHVRNSARKRAIYSFPMKTVLNPQCTHTESNIEKSTNTHHSSNIQISFVRVIFWCFTLSGTHALYFSLCHSPSLCLFLSLVLCFFFSSMSLCHSVSFSNRKFGRSSFHVFSLKIRTIRCRFFC